MEREQAFKKAKADRSAAGAAATPSGRSDAPWLHPGITVKVCTCRLALHGLYCALACECMQKADNVVAMLGFLCLMPIQAEGLSAVADLRLAKQLHVCGCWQHRDAPAPCSCYRCIAYHDRHVRQINDTWAADSKQGTEGARLL